MIKTIIVSVDSLKASLQNLKKVLTPSEHLVVSSDFQTPQTIHAAKRLREFLRFVRFDVLVSIFGDLEVNTFQTLKSKKVPFILVLVDKGIIIDAIIDSDINL